ncbi:MAG: hypothetical protein WHS89_08720 [Acidimicrobiales bacterium]
MGNAAFLLVAVVVSVVGSLIIWYRQRRPKTFMSSIEEFQREMKALGRERGGDPSRWRTPRPRRLAPGRPHDSERH